MVEPARFCAKLANLHHSSTSPNGKFGFHCPTSRAREEWSDTWEECFVKLIRSLLKMTWDARGPDDDLASLSASLLEVVIPRLLRPLETDGRRVKPSLRHGTYTSEQIVAMMSFHPKHVFPYIKQSLNVSHFYLRHSLTMSFLT